MSPRCCSTCSKSFARKGDLLRHELIHSGIKPHVCGFCGKGFTQFSGLKTHLNVHTGAKPYICGIGTCKKAFGDPSSRTRHRRETHRREGAYKCIIPDCATRIKRRSAFVAHLRKHGLDPSSIDLATTVQQGDKGGNSPPSPFAGESKNDHKIDSRSVSPFLNDSAGYCIFGNGGEASLSVDNSESSDHSPFDWRRTNWIPANDALILHPTLDQTVHVDLSGHLSDIYAYLSRNFEKPLSFNSVLAQPMDYSLHVAPPSNLPTLELFLETSSDGSQSSWSSPSSTYSTLYTIGLNDDMVSLPLLDNASQVPLPENFLYESCIC